MTGPPEQRPTTLPPLVSLALARLYGWEIARRNRRYDAGRGVVRFDRPVISVGNLSVGGTGKTPMVAHVVGLLQSSGHRPVIAMRGYGSRGGRSDEAQEYRRRFAHVPVLARPDRTHALIEQFSREHDAGARRSDCIVLDDGFQHRRIARDLDIVLVDASRDPFSDRLLPAGWLRERVGSLRRAGLAVITHAETVPPDRLDELSRRIEQVTGRPADAVARHVWDGLTIHDGGRDRDEPGQWLRGKRVVAVCAIGNPAAFLAEARRKVGGPLAAEIVLRDHDPYRPKTLDRIRSATSSANAEAVLTTEKDWSKLAPAGGWPCAVARARLRISFDAGEAALRDAVIQAEASAEPSESVANESRHQGTTHRAIEQD
jgi:tetraacyldisaccharide 4'-kinase